MNEITTTRSNALIDPSVHVWHAEIPIYLFLGGLVAGVMVLTGLRLLLDRDAQEGREPSRALALAPWSAPLLLTLGMVFLWLDLENRWNAYRFYLAFRPTSPMSWGSWILVAVYPVSIAFAWLSTPRALREPIEERVPLLARLSAWTERRRRELAFAVVLLGGAVGVYTGVLLGTMAARPMWNSAILGPLFLVSGLSSAAAYLLLQRVKDDERLMLGRIDAGLIVVELLVLTLWLVGLSSGGASSRAAAWLVLGGPYTAAFWTLVVVMGLLTPIAAEWMEARHKLLPGRVSAALVLVGGFALRWIVVFAGQESAVFAQTAIR